MEAKFLPADRNGRLFRLVEEMGEVLHVIGKAGRFGMHSHHPEAPDVSNAELILCELADLEHAIAAVRPDLEAFAAKARKQRAGG